MSEKSKKRGGIEMETLLILGAVFIILTFIGFTILYFIILKALFKSDEISIVVPITFLYLLSTYPAFNFIRIGLKSLIK